MTKKLGRKFLSNIRKSERIQCQVIFEERVLLCKKKHKWGSHIFDSAPHLFKISSPFQQCALSGNRPFNNVLSALARADQLKGCVEKLECDPVSRYYHNLPISYHTYKYVCLYKKLKNHKYIKFPRMSLFHFYRLLWKLIRKIFIPK